MIKKFNFFFITLCGVGRIKYAPGTFASLIVCLIFFFLLSKFSISILLFIFLIISLYSFIAINNSFDTFNTEDPQEIVIDEAVGQLIPLFALPVYETLYIAPKEFYFVAAFVLFRIFDIWKPFPINYVDNNTKGSLGIMLDDIIAGIYTTLILLIVFIFLGA